MAESVTDRLIAAAKKKALEKAREKLREKVLQTETAQKILRAKDSAEKMMGDIQQTDAQTFAKNTALRSKHVQKILSTKANLQQRARNFQSFANAAQSTSQAQSQTTDNSNEGAQQRQQEQESQIQEEEHHSGEGKAAMAAQAAQIFAGKHRIKNTLKLAFALRKSANEHDPTAFLVAFILAAIKDFTDILSFGWMSPVTWIMPFILAVILWGRGTFLFKVFLWILAGLEIIPALNMLPTQCILVAYAFYESEKQSNEDKAKAKKLEDEAKKLEKDIRRHSRRQRMADAA